MLAQLWDMNCEFTRGTNIINVYCGVFGWSNLRYVILLHCWGTTSWIAENLRDNALQDEWISQYSRKSLDIYLLWQTHSVVWKFTSCSQSLREHGWRNSFAETLGNYLNVLIHLLRSLVSLHGLEKVISSSTYVKYCIVL